jgi:hypothetical protein
MSKYGRLTLGIGSLANATRLDLAIVEAMMLWPDDEDARAAATATATVAFYRATKPALTPEETENLIAMAADALPLGVIHNEVRRSLFVSGTIAGQILIHAIGKRSLDMPVTMDEAIKQAIKPFHGKKSEWKFSPQTINNKVWPTYRPVAHYWAAAISRSGKRDGAFPCELRNFAEFLAEAEAYRRLGEATRLTTKSPKTVLLPSESVLLPPAIGVLLPVVELTFGQRANA